MMIEAIFFTLSYLLIGVGAARLLDGAGYAFHWLMSILLWPAILIVRALQ